MCLVRNSPQTQCCLFSKVLPALPAFGEQLGCATFLPFSLLSWNDKHANILTSSRTRGAGVSAFCRPPYSIRHPCPVRPADSLPVHFLTRSSSVDTRRLPTSALTLPQAPFHKQETEAPHADVIRLTSLMKAFGDPTSNSLQRTRTHSSRRPRRPLPTPPVSSCPLCASCAGLSLLWKYLASFHHSCCTDCPYV